MTDSLPNPDSELSNDLYKATREHVARRLYGVRSIQEVKIDAPTDGLRAIKAMDERMRYEMEVRKSWITLKAILLFVCQLLAISGLILIVRVLVFPDEKFIEIYKWMADGIQGAICFPIGIAGAAIIFWILEAIQ